jgi:signal transduction histidine kinase
VAFGIAQFASLAFENARLVEELETATRLKLEFVSTISHELRTPLGVMLGYAEMLGDDSQSGQRASLLATIQRTGVELLELIDDTLNLNRLEAGYDPLRLETVALQDFFTELAADSRRCSACRRRAGTGAGDAAAHGSSQAPHDPQNLVGNALKFTPDGSVTVRYGPTPGGAMRHRARASSRDLRDVPGRLAPARSAVWGSASRRRLVNQLGGEVRGERAGRGAPSR